MNNFFTVDSTLLKRFLFAGLFYSGTQVKFITNKKKVLFFFIILLFSFNAFAQPSRDNCSGATTLTSSTSCSNIGANLGGATASTGLPAGCEAPGIHYDIWYRFKAVSNSHTVTISNRQNNFTNPEVQIYRGSCASLISIACAPTAVTATGLTINDTFYIRISNIGTLINNQARFDICVTHPEPPPANDNCNSATTLTSAVSCNSITSNLHNATSAGPAGACGGATATTTYDVWFRFQATATNQTVSINNTGIRLPVAATNSTYFEIMSGTCGSLTSLGCQNLFTSSRLTTSGLTIGTFYYVRVYVLLNPTASPTSDWNFNICVQQPPTNDECTGAVNLTPGATCTNTAGSLDLATSNTSSAQGCFAANTYNDVWYSFIASTVSHTITISSLGANLLTPRIQIYSGNCATSLSLSCVSANTLTQAGLVIGQTYYVRIANTTNPSGTGTVANFNICITAAGVPPANDLCSGAIALTSGVTCSNISGTLIRATATSGLAACGNNGSGDVWYSFIAQTAYPNITLSSVGANFSSAGPRIQLFSGTCAALVSMQCASTLTLTPAGAGLTPGNNYFIRITSNTSGVVTTGTFTFNLCITDQVDAAIDYGKSYVNLTDGTVGGPINTGDVLEIRATLVIARSGSPIAVKSIDSLAFYDTLSAGKGFGYISNTMALRTNEGKLFRPTSSTFFTDPHDVADAGWYTTGGTGTDTAIQINMGLNSSYNSRGKLRSNSRPSFFSNTCIIMATYRVTVNAPNGTKINFGGGAFRYRDSATGVFYTINFPKDSLIVYTSPDICNDAVSGTNILGDEFNGTFGVPSGSPVYPQNRGTSPNTDYLYGPFNPAGPNDYYYAVANNTSLTGTTNQLVPKPSGPTRVFGQWDITGDHTGASNTAKGNLPCNLSLPISSTNPCGYMLVINSAYKTDNAFEFSVTGACTETYYEISGWFKNICYKCGCDSVGRGGGSAGYIPTSPGDSSGVRPNIAVEINGIDYYTTGDLLYQGLGGTQSGSDTLNNWVKRAFVYKTGPTETSFTMSFRNNAPGGGGNDWALDDIGLRTCFPKMTYSPTTSPVICQGNTLVISDTVRSYFNGYVYYKWQRDIGGNGNWIDLAGTSGTASPVLIGGIYEFISNYTVPPSATTASNDGDLYRLVVATTAANRASSCFFTDDTPITLDVLTNCGPILKTSFLSISGRLQNKFGNITWVASREEEPVKYELQKSKDGYNFFTIATIDGFKNPSFNTNQYNYTDTNIINGKVFYQIVMISNANTKKYSRVIELETNAMSFAVMNVINPFSNELHFDIESLTKVDATIQLIDQFGRTVTKKNYLVQKGVNAITIINTEKLAAGIYILKVESSGVIYTRKVLKIKG